MVFQWYLFVLLIVVALFSAMLGQERTIAIESGGVKHEYGWAAMFVVAIPLIYLAATRSDSIGDTAAYRNGFLSLPSSLSELPSYLESIDKDRGFSVFGTIIKAVIGNNDVLYFAIIATICILCVTITYKKYSCNFIISMFLFIASGDYIQWTFNGMRQFIAASVLFACVGLIVKKKYIPAIAIILLLSTIHASALIMIPVIFIVQGKAWNTKTVLFIAAVLASLSFTEQFTDVLVNIMENTQYSSEVDQFLSTEGTNIFRVFVFCIPALMSLVFRNRIRKADDPVVSISVGMAIMTAGAYILSSYTSGIFLGRIPIYFSLYNYILIPWIIENVFTRKSARLIYVIMIVLYLAFYYYQVEITWAL